MLIIDLRLPYDETGRNQLYVEYSEKKNKDNKYYINDNTPKVFTANNGSRPFLIYQPE